MDQELLQNSMDIKIGEMSRRRMRRALSSTTLSTSLERAMPRLSATEKETLRKRLRFGGAGFISAVDELVAAEPRGIAGGTRYLAEEDFFRRVQREVGARSSPAASGGGRLSDRR
jgi:hypothetical protein